MNYNQAKNIVDNRSQKEHLAHFLNCLSDAEIALQAYLAVQPGSIRHAAGPAEGPQAEADDLKLLRQRAEQASFDESIDLEGLSGEEINHLFHELQVHQVELSLQNEELRRAQLELEDARDRYARLYDFAPAGLCTIDQKGTILESNATLAHMLGLEVITLVHNRFQNYIQKEDQDQFYLYHRAALQGEVRNSCEIHMVKPGGELFVAQVESRVAPDLSDRLWLVVSDISHLKRVEETAELYREIAAARAGLEAERNRLFDRPEAERLYLSQELHDGPMQVLYGVFYKLKSLSQEGTRSVEADRILSDCYETISEVIKDLRGIASELRPPTLMTLGLEKAIRSHVKQFRTEHPNIKVLLKLTPDGKRLPERVRLALFRIYQQAMANILRHAQASQVQIGFVFDGRSATLEIEDNGRGFEVPQRLVGLVRKGHLGLVGIAERADSIGGKVTISSQPGQGTTIRVTVNLSQDLVSE